MFCRFVEELVARTPAIIAPLQRPRLLKVLKSYGCCFFSIHSCKRLHGVALQVVQLHQLALPDTMMRNLLNPLRGSGEPIDNSSQQTVQ